MKSRLNIPSSEMGVLCTVDGTVFGAMRGWKGSVDGDSVFGEENMLFVHPHQAYLPPRLPLPLPNGAMLLHLRRKASSPLPQEKSRVKNDWHCIAFTTKSTTHHLNALSSGHQSRQASSRVPGNPASSSNPSRPQRMPQFPRPTGRASHTTNNLQITSRYLFPFSPSPISKTNILNTVHRRCRPFHARSALLDKAVPYCSLTSPNQLVHLSPTRSTRGNSVARTGECPRLVCK